MRLDAEALATDTKPCAGSAPRPRALGAHGARIIAAAAVLRAADRERFAAVGWIAVTVAKIGLTSNERTGAGRAGSDCIRQHTGRGTAEPADAEQAGLALVHPTKTGPARASLRHAGIDLAELVRGACLPVRRGALRARSGAVCRQAQLGGSHTAREPASDSRGLKLILRAVERDPVALLSDVTGTGRYPAHPRAGRRWCDAADAADAGGNPARCGGGWTVLGPHAFRARRAAALGAGDAAAFTGLAPLGTDTASLATDLAGRARPAVRIGAAPALRNARLATRLLALRTGRG
jgi:hypothetical protein